MITEWKDLVGHGTIIKVQEYFLGGYVIFFEDGEFALIDGDGEERHGQHWPVVIVEAGPRTTSHILAIQQKLPKTQEPQVEIKVRSEGVTIRYFYFA